MKKVNNSITVKREREKTSCKMQITVVAKIYIFIYRISPSTPLKRLYRLRNIDRGGRRHTPYKNKLYEESSFKNDRDGVTNTFVKWLKNILNLSHYAKTKMLMVR